MVFKCNIWCLSLNLRMNETVDIDTRWHTYSLRVYIYFFFQQFTFELRNFEIVYASLDVSTVCANDYTKSSEKVIAQMYSATRRY